jgi:hypothetical protein
VIFITATPFSAPSKEARQATGSQAASDRVSVLRDRMKDRHDWKKSKLFRYFTTSCLLWNWKRSAGQPRFEHCRKPETSGMKKCSVFLYSSKVRVHDPATASRASPCWLSDLQKHLIGVKPRLYQRDGVFGIRRSKRAFPDDPDTPFQIPQRCDALPVALDVQGEFC